ncbi:hypoxia-inducible factor 1-alpha-like isoform X2 [Hypanus sabinus]|uniref:hypoxia-inducible factor 1-alpha-like isoform X2 n=1 Tax=Hypanus sabinus TaxID=79690 RepID=UPI0028C3C950|nr:hypoxia-inducible factor 1-alpha-like isoform X2 [Hypanus sabinus]
MGELGGEAEAPAPAPAQQRRERSRDAARSRRGQETEVMYQLAQLLPLPRGAAAHLDKASVMRVTISYLRLRTLLRSVPAESGLAAHLNAFYLRALDGFFMVLTEEGDIVYLSENVNRYLGLTQLALIGHSIFEFIHPCDEEEVKDLLMTRQGLTAKQEAQAHRDFFMRMKSTLVNGKRTVAIKSATWRVLHCTGHVQRCEVEPKSPSSQVAPESRMAYLLMICEPVPDPTSVELLLDSKSFLSRHGMDMKFTYCDARITELCGHRPDLLLGRTAYEFYHSLDSDHMTKTHQILLNKGQVSSGQYRFLAKNGGYVWLETQATVIYSGDNFKPESIVCINYVLSEVVDDTLILSLDQNTSHQEPAVDPGKTQELLAQRKDNPTGVDELAQSCVDIVISLDLTDRLDSSAFHFTRKLSEGGEEPLMPEEFCSPALCKLLSPIFNHRLEPIPSGTEPGPRDGSAQAERRETVVTRSGDTTNSKLQDMDLEMLAPYISMEEDFQLNSFESLMEGTEGLVCPSDHPETESNKSASKRQDSRGLAKLLTDCRSTQPKVLSGSQPAQPEVLGAAGDPVISQQCSVSPSQGKIQAYGPSNQPLVFGGPGFTPTVEKALRAIFQPQDTASPVETGVCESLGTGQDAATPKAGVGFETTNQLDAGGTESESSQRTPSKDRSFSEKSFTGDQKQQELQIRALCSLKRKHGPEHKNLLAMDISGVTDHHSVGTKRVRNIVTSASANPFTPTPPMKLTMHLLQTEAPEPPRAGC